MFLKKTRPNGNLLILMRNPELFSEINRKNDVEQNPGGVLKLKQLIK
jgi:hypothetical protein